MMTEDGNGDASAAQMWEFFADSLNYERRENRSRKGDSARQSCDRANLRTSRSKKRLYLSVLSRQDITVSHETQRQTVEVTKNSC
jgi:hypothetical protein